MLLDTNIVIYFAKPGGEELSRWIDDPAAFVSIVTRIEALGFPRISADEEAAIKEALSAMPEAGLSDAVAERAIGLRQQRKMGIGDAIVAATALVHEVPLVTRNIGDFKHIAGLRLINPFESAA